MKYNQINVIINSLPILAESVNLSQEGTQSPAYILNNKLPIDNIPQGIQNTINITYAIETNNEPNFLLISGWKNSPLTGNLQAIINIGNIHSTGFLTNYSFSLSPNSPVVAQATYSVFHQITGNFIAAESADANLYNLKNSSGIAHFWTASFQSGLAINVSTNNILQMNYDFNANITPHFALGKVFPVQVTTLDASENINITSELQKNIQFSGQTVQQLFSGINNLKLKNLSSNWDSTIYQLDFPLSGFISQNNRVNVSNNNLILFESQFSKNY